MDLTWDGFGLTTCCDDVAGTFSLTQTVDWLQIDRRDTGWDVKAPDNILQSLLSLHWLHRQSSSRDQILQMATSFYPNVTATVEEHLTSFIDFTITAYDHWRTISSEHTVARALTISTIAAAVDANLTNVDPAVSGPFSFLEWFAPRYPYIFLYIFFYIYEIRRHVFHGGRHTWLGPIAWFLAFYIFESLDFDPQLKILKKYYAEKLRLWLSDRFNWNVRL